MNVKSLMLSVALCWTMTDVRASAMWISPGEDYAPTNPAPVFVRKLFLERVPTQALVRVAAAGWFELTVNGRKVGNDVLEPVTCQPDRCISEVSHDLREYLRAGTNEIGLIVGNGWFGCAVPEETWGFHEANWHRHVPPSVRATVSVDGRDRLVTDGTWRVYDSPIVFSALRSGERYDARREGRRFNERPATPLKYAPLARVAPEDATPCRILDAFAPAAVLRAPDGDAVYDFRHNLAGWCEIAVKGSAGAKVTVDYDEALKDDGSLLGYVNCYVNKPWLSHHDEYVLRGAAVERWHPRFVYHGFRYAKVHVEGAAELVSIRAQRVGSDFASVGTLVTSDRDFSRLHAAAMNSYRANFVGIPTDCPHREKNGWTGDAQLVCATGLWNFDAADGYRHFLRMMLDAQAPNGAVPCILPACERFGFYWGSGPAWDALLFELPRQLYRFYGDADLAREAYPAMKRYLAFLAEKEDAEGLIEYGLGDWCHAHLDRAVAVRFTDSAYYYHFHRELAFWAQVFGETDLAKTLNARADRIAACFNRAFYRGDGVYAKGEWTALAAPLFFRGLCAKGEERVVAEALVRRVRDGKYACEYGILGSKWIPRALAEYGYADDAWRLFTHRDGIGYLRWLENGYDTLWERFIVDGAEVGSRNHVMFADFSAWAYEYVAGIEIAAPGFRQVRFRPRFISGVESFEARHRTRYGLVVAGWRRDERGTPVFYSKVPDGIEVIGDL